MRTIELTDKEYALLDFCIGVTRDSIAKSTDSALKGALVALWSKLQDRPAAKLQDQPAKEGQ